MFSLMPRERIFFDLFEQAAKNMQTGAEALVDLLSDYRDVEAKVKRIKDLEHAGDDITHRSLELLNKTFITPFDREDIHDIASRIDDVMDFIHTAANRMMLYKIASPTEDARKLGDCLAEATGAVVEAVARLRDLRDPEGVLKLCIVIHTHENTGDRLVANALAALFESFSPVDIIKWKDIYQDLEMATDRCEDVANALEAVVLKNA